MQKIPSTIYSIHDLFHPRFIPYPNSRANLGREAAAEPHGDKAGNKIGLEPSTFPFPSARGSSVGEFDRPSSGVQRQPKHALEENNSPIWKMTDVGEAQFGESGGRKDAL